MASNKYRINTSNPLKAEMKCEKHNITYKIAEVHDTLVKMVKINKLRVVLEIVIKRARRARTPFKSHKHG